ncbi:MAG: BamA/TamA family outer membrane protein [Pseudomonadota bacterium]
MSKTLFLLLSFCFILFSESLFSQEVTSQQSSQNPSQNKIEQTVSMQSVDISKNIAVGIAYEVSFDFTSNVKTHLDKDSFSSLEELLLKISETHRLENKPPLSVLILNRRAKSDITVLQKALRSRGYYAAKIKYRLNTSIKPAKLIFLVNSGTAYLFDQLQLELSKNYNNRTALKLPLPEDIGLTPGIVADARLVIKAEKLMIQKLKQQSYAYSKIVSKKFTVDHKKQTMQVWYEINPGPIIHLGDVNFTGMKSVDDDFLQTLVGWKNDQLYHPDLIKKTTKNILESNLFSTVRVELDPSILLDQSTQQTIPVIVTLKERLHRSVKASAGFDTDTGITIGAKWTHRNYFGAGEKLSIEAAWTGVGPLLDIRFGKPSFYSSKQSFVANIKLQNEDTDAYDSTSFNLGAGIERTLMKSMKLSLGLAFRHSQITDKSISDSQQLNIDSSQNFSLLYIPLKFTWDFSNDMFEPDKGGKILIQMAPFKDIQSDLKFGKLYASYIHYLKILSDPKFILAGRAVIAQTFGADAYELPADERFYSGGGGSVRGYGYQLIGPLDKNNKPLGGNALLEFAVESRVNFTQNIGAVVFVDAGSAFSSDFFDGSSDLLYGAGLGVRYSSPMGPLRADIAIPMNPRDGVDDSFQIYLSIGQAF